MSDLRDLSPAQLRGALWDHANDFDCGSTYDALLDEVEARATDLVALGRRVAELEAERKGAAPLLQLDPQTGEFKIIGCERCDAAQRDAATLRGALEGLLDGVWSRNGRGINEATVAAERTLAALAPAPAQATSEEGR